jgi:hypothetical protein
VGEVLVPDDQLVGNELRLLFTGLQNFSVGRQLRVVRNSDGQAIGNQGEQVVIRYKLEDGTRDKLVFDTATMTHPDPEASLLGLEARAALLRIASAQPHSLLLIT